jgi:hypothetical protein
MTITTNNIRIKTALVVAISALKSMGIPFTPEELIQAIKTLCADDEDLYTYTMCLLTLAAGELIHAHAHTER